MYCKQLGTGQQVQGVAIIDHCFHACRKGKGKAGIIKGVGHLIFALVVHQNVSLGNMEVSWEIIYTSKS